jgi:sRNA-binding protein
MAFDANPIIDRLCEAFPECFNRLAPKPLKIGIGEEVLALAGVHPLFAEVSRTQLRLALKFYIRRFTYRKALATGGPRYGLDGQPAGEVTPDQQAFAKTPRPKKPAAPGTGEPALATEPALPPIDQTALLQEIMAMAIPGKLEVTIKISQLPEAKPASAQTMLFAVQADGKTVVVEVKNKVWNTLKTAAENYPQWVAAITGKMGQGVTGGFRLDGPAMQVFEKKPKPEAAAAATVQSKAPVVETKPPVVEPKAPEERVVESPTATIGRVKLTLKGRIEKQTD